MAEIERLMISLPFAALKSDIDKGSTDLAEGRVQDFDAGRIIERGKKLLAPKPRK